MRVHAPTDESITQIMKGGVEKSVKLQLLSLCCRTRARLRKHQTPKSLAVMKHCTIKNSQKKSMIFNDIRNNLLKYDDQSHPVISATAVCIPACMRACLRAAIRMNNRQTARRFSIICILSIKRCLRRTEAIS